MELKHDTLAMTSKRGLDIEKKLSLEKETDIGKLDALFQ